ncbi:MAG: VIT domain-containing protein [Pirellulales bacterium]
MKRLFLHSPATKLCAALVAACLATAAADARAAGMLVADGGFGGVLEIKEHAARVTINNGIAVTEVDQTFVNTEKRIVEALYIFPVPKGASVSNFTMMINGREMIGEVVEKERARKIYDSYKQQRRDPGLLEQVDYKTFELAFFRSPQRPSSACRSLTAKSSTSITTRPRTCTRWPRARCVAA